jgi:opacity protein-like surface antigen
MKKISLLAFVLFSGPAWAQSGEFYFSAGQSLLSNAGIGSTSATGTKDDFKLDDGFRFGFRFGFNTYGRFGHEIQYAYNRSHLLQNGFDLGGMAIHQAGYNFLVYATKDSARIRPFVTGGGHFNNYVPPGSSAASGGGSTKFGLNYGAGVKYKLTSLFALRFDVRRYDTPKPNFGLLQREGWLHQVEVSGGVGVHF